MFSGIRRKGSRRTTSCRGYTLIEVIIALAIFSAMVLLATMALDQGLKQYRGLMQKGLSFWPNAKQTWIDRSMSSIVDYYVDNDENQWFPYFRGDGDMISYVSLAPLAGDLPVAVWIVNEQQDNGRHSLLYYELPVYTKTVKELERDYVFGDYKKGRHIKLLDDVEDIRFKYYGYDVLEKRDIWTDRFEGKDKGVLPAVVKITYTSGGKEHMLAFRVNTDSVLKMTYNEMFSQQQ